MSPQHMLLFRNKKKCYVDTPSYLEVCLKMKECSDCRYLLALILTIHIMSKNLISEAPYMLTVNGFFVLLLLSVL